MYFIIDGNMEILGTITEYAFKNTNLKDILEKAGLGVYGDGELRIEFW